MAPKKKGNRRRKDMEALPPRIVPGIPSTFEEGLKALVKPVTPKKQEAKEKPKK